MSIVRCGAVYCPPSFELDFACAHVWLGHCVTSQLGDAERSVSIKQKHELGFVIYLRGPTVVEMTMCSNTPGFRFSVYILVAWPLIIKERGHCWSPHKNTHKNDVWYCSSHMCRRCNRLRVTARCDADAAALAGDVKWWRLWDLCVCFLWVEARCLYDKSRFFVVDN